MRGKIVLKMLEAQNQRALCVLGGKLYAETSLRKHKRHGCSGQDPLPAIDSINRNGRSREAGGSCSYTGHAFGQVSGEGPQGK